MPAVVETSDNSTPDQPVAVRTFRHRFWPQVVREAAMGQSHFLVEGALDDWFYSPYWGTHDFVTTLVTRLLLTRTFGVDRVLVIHAETRTDSGTYSVTSYDNPHMDDAGLAFDVSQFATVEQALTGKEPAFTSNYGAAKPKDEPATEDQGVRNSNPNASSYQVNVDSLPVLAGAATARCAVVLADFATAAGLYPNLGERANHYAQALESIWKTDNRLLTFLLLDDAQPLREHFFPQLTDQIAVIKLAKPGLNEIICAVSRRDDRSPSMFEAYRTFATVLNNEKKSLKESVHLFARLRKHNPEDFERPGTLRERLRQELDISIDYKSWDDVVVGDDVRRQIRSTLSSFNAAVNRRVPPDSKGILFHGPPGTGKTLLAKVIAADEGFSFFALTLSDAKAEFVGQTSANIKRIFDAASAAAPSLIFIDEIDGILQARGDRNVDSFTRDAVNELLPRLDGVDTGSHGVFLVGATNRLDLIDPAAISRLDLIEIRLPDCKTRVEIFRRELGLGAEAAEVEAWLNDLGTRSEGLAGRDIHKLKAAMMRVANVRDLKQFAAIVRAVSSESREKFADEGFKLLAAELTKKLCQCGSFLDPSTQVTLPCKSLQFIDETLKNVARLHRVRTRFTDHKLRPVSNVLLVADPDQRSKCFARVLAANLNCRVFSVGDAMLQMTLAGLDEIVSDLNQLAAMTGIVVYFQRITSSGNAIDSRIHYVLSQLDATVVACESTEPEGTDGMFDFAPRIPDSYSVGDIAAWVERTLEDCETKYSLTSGTTPLVIARKLVKAKTVAGLAAVEREVTRALRNAVAKDSCDKECVKLKIEHFT